MNRTAIAILVAAAMLLMSVPGQVTAHDSTAADLNALAYDEVWPLLGPGGTTDNPTLNDGLGTLGLDAEKRGGDAANQSCTHHDPGIQDVDEAFDEEDECTWESNDPNGDNGAVQDMTFYQCNGAQSFSNPTEEADIEFETAFPVRHSNLTNGIFEATGSFFVPVEFDGEDADQVDQVWFGFAHSFAWPASSSLCQPPFPLSGAYYEFYRGDQDGSDGWEIPVNTLLVPDAPYGAVLRALDAEGNTLAASFVYSNVNNYLNDANWQPGLPSACDQDRETGTALCDYHDTTPPIATVFDANQNTREDTTANTDGTGDTACDDGVALEYGEPLAQAGSGPAVKVLNNATGEEIQWSEYNPPDRDVDSAPIATTARDNWGPGICISSPPGDMTVKAWDQSGNIGKQTIS